MQTGKHGTSGFQIEIIFLILNANICRGYSKEPSRDETDLLSTQNVLIDGLEYNDNFKF